jgi:histone acetyltransferase (RNA polymerase elongator complex component)
MSVVKHYTIPVFTPEMACPFRCVFCHQQKISGHMKSPDFDEVTQTIRSHLKTFREGEKHVEVGFFGGTFTGIPVEIQENYLQRVQPFLASGEVQGIRLSTRPDYIDPTVLERLHRYGVTTIELGAQSLDDEVLRLSRRGHTVRQVKQAAEMIREADFHLGLQMMIGLPGDTLEKALATADKIIAFGADNTRIYPTLVIRDTVLHRWYTEGQYRPLSLDDAVQWSKMLLLKFEQAGVRVIRLGLHPSEGLLTGEELVAGPFHPSFRELVLTEIWHDLLFPLTKKSPEYSPGPVIEVPAGQLNYAIGYQGKNKKMLQSVFPQVRFRESGQLTGRTFSIR